MKSKTMLCIFLTAAMAAAAFLPSCSNAQDEISSSTSSAVSVDSTLPISSALSSIPPTGYTSSAPISSIPLPDPVSGTYNSQSIIMQYSVITDYIWPQDNLIPTYFLNGYTPFWYYGTDSIDPIFAYSNIGATFLDKTGRMICEPIYASASYFNDEGLGLVQKELDSGRWTYIDADGNEVSEVQNPQFSDIQISEYVNGLKFAKPGQEYSYLGLFGRIEDAQIRNLNLEAEEISGGDNVAVLTGCAEGQSVICNVSVSGSVYAGGDAGGIAGEVTGKTKRAVLENCRADNVIINSEGRNSFVGGIAGSLVSCVVSWIMNTYMGASLTGDAMMAMMDTGFSETALSIIPLWLIGAAVLFSVFMGVGAGFFPSNRAVKISALEAMKA